MLPPVDEGAVKAAIPEIREIEHRASGGQKHVYRVVIGAQAYALKVVPLDIQGTNIRHQADPKIADRVRREVNILGACDTQHLVKLGPLQLDRTTFSGMDALFYTEDWISGRDVASILREDGPLAPKDVVKIGRDVTAAIDSLWARKTVHRDIKPSNIIRRDSDGSYVLLDLGYALDQIDVSLTAFGLINGTVPYFSPEQCNPRVRRKLDFRSDFYSLAVTMYEALTAAHPTCRSDMSHEAMIDAILRTKVDPPSKLVSGVTGRVDWLITTNLKKQPYLRFSPIAKFRDALDLALTSEV